jgi:hypothetical protein
MRGQADYCRHKAAECSRAATYMSDGELRGQLMELGRQWRDLADQIALLDAQPGIQIGTGHRRR